jgi:hypothetical protein
MHYLSGGEISSIASKWNPSSDQSETVSFWERYGTEISFPSTETP